MVNGKFAVALIYHILLPLVDGAFFVLFFALMNEHAKPQAQLAGHSPTCPLRFWLSMFGWMPMA